MNIYDTLALLDTPATPDKALLGWEFLDQGLKKHTGTIQNVSVYEYKPGRYGIRTEFNKYIDKYVIIKGDPNLKPCNIKQGVELFGIVGTYGGE